VIPGRTVLFRSLSRLQRLFDGAGLTATIAVSLIPPAFLLIVAIRNNSNLTNISCGLRPADDSLQHFMACGPRLKLRPLCISRIGG
jgi:hypothetical protein